MPLFTDPKTLSDGTSNHIFSFRAQLPTTEKNTVAGEYIETAASLASSSKLAVKHNSSKSTVTRRLFQRTVNKVISDGATFKPITVNFTITCHPEHTLAQLSPEVLILTAGIADATFLANFNAGLI